MTKGSQIGVGTVLARSLTDLTLWGTVDVWAKFKVSTVRRLSKIYLSLCDSGANTSAIEVGQVFDDTWRFTHHYKSSSIDNWANGNLRGVLTFQGTTTPANVGALDVYVEWFAFGLTA
jgi:hypothetical protein